MIAQRQLSFAVAQTRAEENSIAVCAARPHLIVHLVVMASVGFASALCD